MSIFLLSDTQKLNNTLKEKLSSEISAHDNKIAYISSSPQDAELKWFHNTEAEYVSVNPDSTLEYFDLGESFTDAQLATILDCGTIHLSGGNTYEFLDTVRKRNLKPLLERHLAANGLIIGVSAGAIILTPHIGTTLMCGDVNHVGVEDLTGMNFFDFCFLPHLGTHYQDTPENHTQLQNYALSVQRKVYVAADSDGVYVSEKSIEVFGEVLIVEP